MKYRVVNTRDKYNPQRYDEAIGWVAYRYYSDDLLFDTESEAWSYINTNPSSLNVSWD